MVGKFPVELLDELFKLVREDYEALHSRNFVSKSWSKVFIPTLWKDPFRCNDSMEILINCLLAEDDGLFTKKKFHCHSLCSNNLLYLITQDLLLL